PGNYSSASIEVTDNLGKVIKAVQLKSANGNIIMDASLLSAGTYQYSLIVDGKIIDTRRMVVTK
ncbi:MAG: T9SS type A sorting domain-containing protein, partial [Flavisolibacter sp.]